MRAGLGMTPPSSPRWLRIGATCWPACSTSCPSGGSGAAASRTCCSQPGPARVMSWRARALAQGLTSARRYCRQVRGGRAATTSCAPPGVGGRAIGLGADVRLARIAHNVRVRRALATALQWPRVPWHWALRVSCTMTHRRPRGRGGQPNMTTVCCQCVGSARPRRQRQRPLGNTSTRRQPVQDARA